MFPQAGTCDEHTRSPQDHGPENDRATAELAISNVLDDNKAKISNFLKWQNNQVVIVQKVKHPIGTSFKKNTTTSVPGTEIHLVIRRDNNMHNGYRIHTGHPNP
ncbi:RNase A-like domain-containing protein [Pseudomonas sp. M5A4_2d]